MLEIKHLLLEVTRQCNMSCKHCMRGDAEDVSMKYDVINCIFQDVRHIEHLCLTGGEPSLAPNVIRQIVYRAKHWGCRIDSFFCATNGKVYSKQFAEALKDLYKYCTDKEHCKLTVTLDQFHSNAANESLKEYRKLPFYSRVYEHGNISPYSILNEGRARANGIGGSEIPLKRHLYNYSLHGVRFKLDDTVYINACGDVVLNADLSYKNQTEYRIGSLADDNLPHILLSSLCGYKLDNNKNVFRISFSADANTVSPLEIEDERYFKDEIKAFGAYHQVIHNLHITPVNLQFGEIPEELRLLDITSLENELADNQLEETKITYMQGEKNIGSVRVCVEYFPLEDMQDG